MSASQFAGGHVTYAGFWWRVLATLIDGVISWLLIVFVTFIAGLGMATATGDIDALYLTGEVAGPIGSFLYYTGFECSSLRATPGKLACSIKVVDLWGEQISFVRSAGRNLGKYVSALIFGIGFMMAGWTHRKQALHDKMAKCLVVRVVRSAERIALPVEHRP
jgi:uncharacterized RDD family membrane protein YckC